MTEIAERLSAALADRYQIERELGAGGMATVYLAHDVRHDRKVALKVLRPELAAVLGAERFVHEIKTTAGLQHPNILPLFDSGEADSFLYYVMPYIEGETLREKLNRETQLSIDEAVQITTDVADALQAAHEQGVIHRDIKPENVLLHKGRAMVADFGIALAVSAAAGGRMTETGLSLGTPHYMSPEQATAEKDITSRSDVYSLASVLYEMLTGEPPHTGASAQAIIMKIVTEEAQQVTELRKSVPLNVAAAVTKALEKLPADRFASAAEFARALGDSGFTAAKTSAPRAQTAPVGQPWSAGRMGLPVFVASLVVAFAAGWLVKPGPGAPPAPVGRFTVPVPSGHSMGAFEPNLAVSPDGQVLAYATDGALHTWSFDRGASQRLDGTENACCPFFSPDGQWVMFNTPTGARRVPVGGGPVTDAPHLQADFGDWSLDETIVYSDFSDGVFRVPAFGGAPQRLTAIDSTAESDHMWPQLLPGGESLLYTSLGPDMLWRGARIVVEVLATKERTIVVEGATFGRYVPTGHILYARADGTLEAVPFDINRRTVSGSPFAVASGLRTAYWGGAASYAVSPSGTLAYVRGSSWGNHLLTWLDRRGNVISQFGRPVTVEVLDLSPDDRYVVTYVASANADVYRFDTETGEERRLTFAETTEDNVVWSPDGLRVAFRSAQAGNRHHIYIKEIDGPTDSTPVHSSDRFLAPRSWSPDGNWLAFEEGERGRAVNLEDGTLLTLPGSGQGEQTRFSPDGRWLAYMSRETGRPEVYVVSFPGLTDVRQVSLNGGVEPRWSTTSGELFFWEPDSEALMVSQVSTGGSFSNSAPTPLFTSSDYRRRSSDRGFDVAADGKRFLIAAHNPDALAREIHVVLNFFEELRARVRD